jgi:membrane protein implicated in regulation of membrane protease activity
MQSDIIMQYGWLVGGLVLLILEVVLPGVFLLFFGIGALVVGMNVLVLGAGGFFGFGQQILAFVVVSTAAVLIGRHWYGNKVVPEGDRPLNSRGESLLGRQTKVTSSISDGRGRVAIDDGSWVAEGPDLPEGTTVRIVGSRGSILLVEPVTAVASIV